MRALRVVEIFASMWVSAAAMAGCAKHAVDPLAGTYSGTVTTTQEDCTTGASLGAPTTQTEDLVIDHGTGVLLYVGDETCTVYFDPATETATSAMVYPGAICERSQPDGSRIHFVYTSGSLALDGDTLTGSYDVEATTPTGCTRSHVTFTATRV